MDLHTYGLEWVNNETVRIIVDGNVWRETKFEEEGLKDAYSKYMYVQISMATAFESKGEPTDDETNISTVLRSQSAQLRGTAYKMTVTVIPSTGSLLLKLTASTPA